MRWKILWIGLRTHQAHKKKRIVNTNTQKQRNYSKRNIQRKLGGKMNKPSVKNCRITSGSAKYVKLGSRKEQREKEGQLRKMAKKSNDPKCP